VNPITAVTTVFTARMHVPRLRFCHTSRGVCAWTG
jgi:hypothetical protein